MNPSRRFAVLVVALALVVAACGGDETTDTTAAETTTTTETPTTAAETTTTVAETTTTSEVDACAKDNLPLVQAGGLTIATGEPVFPPWMIDDDPTNKQGFESAVAYAIADRLGFADDEVQWVRTGFDEAIAPGPKDFDFNLQQYSITDQRDQVVDFSVPYYVTNQALVAFADNPVVDAATVADLKSYKLGAQIGTTSLAYIESVIAPETQAAVYDTNVDAKSALDAQQVDGLVFDLPTAFYITAVEIPEATIVGVFEVSEEQADRFGLLFAEGSPLKPCVDDAIEDLRADGTLAQLEDEWLTSSGDIKLITN